MINYGLFNNGSNHSFNVFNAISRCKETGEDGIVFDRGEYHFYPDMASEDVMCVSNHDIYGFRRIAFSISDMNDFFIDGGGSTFVFHGDIIPLYINNSTNITVKNVSIDYAECGILDLTVTEVNDGCFDVTIGDGGVCSVKDGVLTIYGGCSESVCLHTLIIRSDGDSSLYSSDTDEEFMIENGVKNESLRVEEVGNGRLRFSGSRLSVRPGMHLLAKGGERLLCNIVSNKSSDIVLENITMHSSYAMGVLAQMCRNITIDKMNVKARGGNLFSLAADATHFVNCTGLVKVTNSSFSDQMDDALNIHGIFTKITDRTDEYIVVRYMHESAKGIGIYNIGDKISVVNPRSLVGDQHYTVKNVEVVNLEYTKLYFDEPTDDIAIGDLVENITNNCDLIFENNRVFNNRARGLLIGTKGRVDIRNNYFRSSGTAILFESDGEYWYESGGTNDVHICGNIFEGCCFGPAHWGGHVIETVPRSESVDGMYYHKFICVTDNDFIANAAPILFADNVEHLVFKNNRSDSKNENVVGRCGKIDM